MTRIGGVLGAVASLALWAATTTAAAAADPILSDPGHVLDRPLADVALVAARADGRSVELLTLDASVTDPGQVRIALLRRDEAWSVVSETTVTFAIPELSDTPWLVGIGQDRFAIVQPLDRRYSPEAAPGRTAVATVGVDRSVDPPALRVGEAVELDLSATASAAADVDGDGTTELVLAGEVNLDCPAVALAVLSAGSAPRVIRQAPIQVEEGSGPVLLGGAALGEWDGRPGTDLLAHVFETCAAPDQPLHHLLALRLSDFSTLADIALDDMGERDPGLIEDAPAPIAVDVDGDGRSEAILTLAGTISALDPADGWRQRVIADGGAVPLGAFGSRRDPPSTTVAWIGPMNGPLGSGIRTSRIARVDGSLAVAESSRQPFADHLPAELDQLVAAHVASPPTGPFDRPSGAGSANALVVDVDLDGCPDIVAPLLLAGCEGTAPPRVGPAFMASRPLMLVGSSEDPRLLVAAGLDWFPATVAPTPTPALARLPGTWRSGSSTRFYLAEGRLQDASTRSAEPGSTPIVGQMVSSEGRIELRGPTGSRLLVRALDRCDCKPRIGTPMADDIGSFLTVEPRGSELLAVRRVPTPVGTAPGASAGAIDIDVREAFGLTDLSPTRGFEVNVVALDTFGRPSRPVRVTAVLDADPPTVAMEAPFLSPPWPFEAGIAGTSEAGASMRLGDGAAVEADESGAFRLPVRLAPWPQTIEVSAVDRSGNATMARVSVMGGLDVRQLPWAAIIAAVVLVAVFIGSVRGSRRAPSVAVVEVVAADEHSPEIEDLGERPLGRG